MKRAAEDTDSSSEEESSEDPLTEYLGVYKPKATFSLIYRIQKPAAHEIVSVHGAVAPLPHFAHEFGQLRVRLPHCDSGEVLLAGKTLLLWVGSKFEDNASKKGSLSERNVRKLVHLQERIQMSEAFVCIPWPTSIRPIIDQLPRLARLYFQACFLMVAKDPSSMDVQVEVRGTNSALDGNHAMLPLPLQQLQSLYAKEASEEDRQQRLFPFMAEGKKRPRYMSAGPGIENMESRASIQELYRRNWYDPKRFREMENLAPNVGDEEYPMEGSDEEP